MIYKNTLRFVAALSVFFFLSISLHAQTGGLVYYLKNSGKLVANKDSADYSMVVMPPDTSVDKNLYIVYEYYKNGKLKFTTNSKTNDLNLQYHGRYMAYFPDGKKMKTGEFEYGVPVGHQISYYPNGKFYNSLNYFPGGKILYNDLRDSTGKILAENGAGDWVDFDTAFKDTAACGKIDSGYRTGIWTIKVNDSVRIQNKYVRGEQKNQNYLYKIKGSPFVKVDVFPSFPGGIEAFSQFLMHTLRYPANAREDHIQGKVIIGFMVNADGVLSNFSIEGGPGGSIGDEALRTMKLSPPWKPALIGGKPVAMKYSVPINFALSE